MIDFVIDAASSAIPQLSSVQLLVVVRVAELGSFGEAAAQLGVAQSSVSRAVQAAEVELGAVLFERGRFGARPTVAGTRVVAHARRALDALEAMRRHGGEAVAGELRIAGCRSALRHLVTPELATLGRTYPEVRLVVRDTSGEHDEIEALVASGEADIGLGRLPMRPELVSTPLVDDEYLVVTSDGAPPLATWDALLAAPFVVCEEDCAPFVAAHVHAHTGRRLEPSVRLRDPHVALGLVAQGQGFTVLSRLVLEPFVPGVRGASLPAPLWRTLGAVVRPQAQGSPLVDVFRTAVLAPSLARLRRGGLARELRFPAGR
ncbi:LysR family transcriptional regulator [Deinococcus yavapaiensis]|uniref:LysR family transcriptional regulator n=1 Tax=Deinococcus yavapaiensis TaxID=309889 RepID=UPI00147637E0|nr:LysR family transcriptional regulator [Deinococcus yavapaiensis]